MEDDVRNDGLRELVEQEPVLALCGSSGAGKTTLLEKAVPALLRRGLRVAVLKHDVHGITLDPAGKDSARLFASGADVVLQGPGEILWRRREAAGRELGPTLRALLADHDLVLVEGHKGTPLKKLWLAGATEQSPPAGVEAVLDVLPRDGSRLERLLAFLDRWLADLTPRRRLLGGILIGGDARRMGGPKQLLSFRGRTFVETVWSALEPHVEEVLLIGSGACPPSLAAARRLPDAVETRGPLAGMLAALRWAPRAAWVLAACDLPLASPEAVAWLVSQRRPGSWAILPRISDRGIEPLLALYEPQARLLLEGVAAQGRATPRLIADDPAVVSPRPPSSLAAAWIDADTPEDLARLGAA
jgi:molybdopterin-guanine dinucleotide biosynthesis protein A